MAPASPASSSKAKQGMQPSQQSSLLPSPAESASSSSSGAEEEPRRSVREVPRALAVGERIRANGMKDGLPVVFSGRVVAALEDGTFDVKFSDGELVRGMPSSHLKLDTSAFAKKTVAIVAAPVPAPVLALPPSAAPVAAAPVAAAPVSAAPVAAAAVAMPLAARKGTRDT